MILLSEIPSRWWLQTKIYIVVEKKNQTSLNKKAKILLHYSIYMHRPNYSDILLLSQIWIFYWPNQRDLGHWCSEQISHIAIITLLVQNSVNSRKIKYQGKQLWKRNPRGWKIWCVESDGNKSSIQTFVVVS